MGWYWRSLLYARRVVDMNWRIFVQSIVGLTVGGVLAAGVSRHDIVDAGRGAAVALQAASNEWNVLAPRLTLAVERARAAAHEVGRVELVAWRNHVMDRVDPGFLDEHLSYI